MRAPRGSARPRPTASFHEDEVKLLDHLTRQALRTGEPVTRNPAFATLRRTIQRMAGQIGGTVQPQRRLSAKRRAGNGGPP